MLDMSVACWTLLILSFRCIDANQYRDPSDIYSGLNITHELAEDSKRLATCEMRSEEYLKNEFTYLKHILRSIVQSCVAIENELKANRCKLLISFVNSELNQMNIFLKDDADAEKQQGNILWGMILNSFQRNEKVDVDFESSPTLISYFTNFPITLIACSYIFIISASVPFAVYIIRLMSPVGIIIFFVFLQAGLIEWFRLYHSAVAVRSKDLALGMPSECVPISNLSYMATISLWISERWAFSDDKCLKYYSTVLVDPLVEVSILEAYSSALRRFCLNHVLEVAATFGRAIKSLMAPLPIQYQFFAFFALVLLVVLLMLVVFGFRIRTPLMTIDVGCKDHGENLEKTVTQRVSAVLEAERKEINELKTKWIVEFNEYTERAAFNEKQVESLLNSLSQLRIVDDAQL